jgi:B12-binding domain/radical SAM domain protein
LTSYDVLFLHPPSFPEYGKKPWFPGPVARTVAIFSPLFIMIPLGVLSIAQHLAKNGFRVKIVNLGELMIDNPSIEIESIIKGLDARVFAIDLHWAVHSNGAIKTAELCKQLHPNSYVVLGGLTASYFAQEVMESYSFVDGVIAGEAEEPMARLANSLIKSLALDGVPGLTYRESNASVRVNRRIQPRVEIDEYDYTDLSLIEPRNRLLSLTTGSRTVKVWNLPVCRGCTLNCVTCGGSEYAYRKILMKEKPSFRSPRRMVEDFQRLDEQGINMVFLFQDCRLGLRSYYEGLLRSLHKEKWSKIEYVSLELFNPVDDEFMRYLVSNRPADALGLTFSPESGSDVVRRAHGRNYGNEAVLETNEKCAAHSVPIDFHFMIALGQESPESLNEMWRLWERIMRRKTSEFFTSVDFGPMVIMDPGSIAYEHPAKFGYRMLYTTFNEMRERLANPSWVDWINYETRYMSRDQLVESIFKATEVWIQLFERYGIFDGARAESERMRLRLEKEVTEEVQNALKNPDGEARSRRLKELDQIYHDPLLSYWYALTSEETALA